MIKHKPRYLIISLITLTIILLASMWFYESKVHENKKIQVPRARETSAKMIAPDTSQIQPKPVQKPDCENHLKDILGIDKCDNNCFAARMAPQNKDLADFISEGWDYPGTASKTPKSKLGRMAIALQNLNIWTRVELVPKKDFAKSEKILEEIVQNDPHNLFPALYYALALKRQGKIEAAQKVLHSHVEKNSQYESYPARYRLDLVKAAGTDPMNAMKVVGINYMMPEPLIGDVSELEELSKVDYLKGMLMIANKRISYENKNRDLFWDRNDDTYARQYLADELPDVGQRLQNFDETSLGHEDYFFYPRNADDKECNLEDVKEKLASRLEGL